MRSNRIRKLSFLVLTALFTFNCRGVDETENHYGSYSAATDLKNRGWLPDWVPHSAAHIYSRQNLDTNAQWLAFEFSSADRQVLAASCSASNLGNMTVPPHPANSAGIPRTWWPLLTRESLKNSYHVYTCPDGGQLMIERSANKAYYWQLR